MGKKKIISLVLAALIFALCTVPVSAADLIGDVDGNGAVTTDDARAILRFAVELDTPSAAQFAKADLDSDGKITTSDARLALRLAVEIDSMLGYVLYEKAHPLFEKSFEQMHPKRSIVQNIYNGLDDWCCYYTLHDVYRPVLKELGYSDEVIEKYAPSMYSKEKITKVADSFFGFSLSFVVSIAEQMEWYTPSLLADYYLNNPEYADTYVFWEYYDNVIDNKIIDPTLNTRSYEPQVGDIVFMSNKMDSYVNGLPTIDHTAQIMKVYDDGTFLCTEGSIRQTDEPDRVARVRERVYFYDSEKATYVWELNNVVNVLMIARPLLP